jgi:hypothetical protein
VGELYPDLRSNAMRPTRELKTLMKEAASKLGVPINCINYTVNYSEEQRRDFNTERFCYCTKVGARYEPQRQSLTRRPWVSYSGALTGFPQALVAASDCVHRDRTAAHGVAGVESAAKFDWLVPN